MTTCRQPTDEAVRNMLDGAESFAAFERKHGKAPASDNVSGSNNPEQRKRATSLDRHQQLSLVPPSQWGWQGAQLNLVQGLLGCGMLALLYGASGAAKTLIAIDLAMHVALGQPWRDRPVRRGFVAYLAPEGGHSVHLRLLAWARHRGIDITDAIPLRTIPVRVDLCHDDRDLSAIIANIHAAVAELGPCLLVVVDTVSRSLAGGDENGPTDMGAFVAHCDRLREATGATVIAVHHTPKEGKSPRGHSALMNAADVRLHVEKVAVGLVALEVVHLKDGEAGAQLLFQIASVIVDNDDNGTDVHGPLVVPTDAKPAGELGRPKAGRLNERQLRMIQALRAHCCRTKQWTVTYAEFSRLAISGGAIDDGNANKHKRIADLRVQLANKGVISIDGAAATVTYLDAGLFT